MPTKPASLPVWNTDATNRTTPSGGKQASGFILNEAPSSSFQNWWQNLVYQWTNYLNAPVGVTTTPAITATAGTGGGSVALRGAAGDNSSVPIIGVAGGVSGPTEASFLASSFPGAAVMGLTGVGGLPGVIGANVATGPGVWGTNSGAAGAGVYGTGGATGTFGGVFAGNAQNISTLNADATSAAPGAGVAAGALGNAVAAYLKQYGTTRGTLQMAPQGTPSAPAAGDMWFTTTFKRLEFHDGDGAVAVAKTLLNHGANTATNSVANTVTETDYAPTATIPANALRNGSIIRGRLYFNVFQTGTPTLTIRVKIGTTFAVYNTVSPTGNAVLIVDFMMTTPSFSGSAMIGSGHMTLSTGEARAMRGTTTPFTGTGSGSVGTVNRTIAQTLSISAQWSVASASNDCQFFGGHVEYLY